MTAFASNVAVAALRGVGETEQERAVRETVERVKWTKREHKVVVSRRTTVARIKGGVQIVKRKKTKRIRTRRADLICAAKRLVGVRDEMKIGVTGETRKEELIAEVYRIHREKAVKVGKACEGAMAIIAAELAKEEYTT